MLPVVNLVLYLIRRVRFWAAYRAAYSELAGLDDRTLAEIKVSRGDIAAIARRTALGAA